MANRNEPKFNTMSLHAGQKPDPQFGARAQPIYMTTSYVFPDTDHAASLFNLERAGHLYSRISNPTVAAFSGAAPTSFTPFSGDQTIDAFDGHSAGGDSYGAPQAAPVSYSDSYGAPQAPVSSYSSYAAPAPAPAPSYGGNFLIKFFSEQNLKKNNNFQLPLRRSTPQGSTIIITP